MDGLRVVLRKLDPAIVKKKTCDFCSRTENDELLYGRLYSLDNITSHYYCLLFASNLQQKGTDNDGILGFMPPEMQLELNKAKKMICSYCDKPGATIICVQRMCKKVFHLPCGMNNGSLHHFFGRFQSFCKPHRPIIKVPQLQLCNPEAPECAICYEQVKRDALCRKVVWAPCCKINAWLHWPCVQKLALSSGYFFRCPRCNNKDIFVTAMRKYGVYIPEKDASWELVPNAYEELLQRHGRCDSEVCVCPSGRDHDKDDTDWEIILCHTCGSQGIHVGCLPYKNYGRKWFCKICSPIAQPSRVAIRSATISSSSSSVTEQNNSGHPERKRSALTLNSSRTKYAKMGSSSSLSEDDEEGDLEVAEIVSSEEEDNSDLEVEVVDVEEDQRTPDRLLTKDGVEIPIVTFNDPIPDNTLNISGDLAWNIECNKPVVEIMISDTEESDTQMSTKSSLTDTICLE